MITFTRYGRLLKFSTDSLAEKKFVKNYLTFAIEGTEHSTSFKNNKWDGLYRFYDAANSTFDYGMLSVVTKHLDKKQIKWAVRGDFLPLSLKGKQINPNLWEHQNQAVKAFLQRPFGRVQFPTRTGKTIFAAELIRLIDGISLFVVDTQDLYLQAITDISTYLKINKEDIGIIKGEQFVIKKITVAMVQTLQQVFYCRTRSRAKRPLMRERKKMLNNYFTSLQFLIVDECHEHTSTDRIDMFKSIKNSKAYLGLSATHNKSESVLKNIRAQSCYGDIIYIADSKKLKQQKILAHESIMLIAIDHNKNLNIKTTKKDVYDNYEDKVIMYNEQRNTIALNIIEILRKLGLKTLVLFQYRDHAGQLQKITGDDLITGTDKLERRTAVKNVFLKRKGGILLVTNIFKKGITLPEAEVFFNVGGGLEQSEVDQKKGRVLGTTLQKSKALIIDFVDIYKYFGRHSLKRIEVYERSAGMENMHIFNFEDCDFYTDVKEFLSTWQDKPT